MPPKKLSVVPEGATAQRATRPLTVLEAAESNDYLAELVALRRRIATAVSDPNTLARDLASLSRRQMEISREIQAIRSQDREDEIGDAAATPDEEWVVS